MRVENFDPSVGDRIKMGDGIRARLLPSWREKFLLRDAEIGFFGG